MTDPRAPIIPAQAPRAPARAPRRALFAALLLLLVAGAGPSPGGDPKGQGEASPNPGLAELVPRARELSEKKLRLETRVGFLVALQDVEAALAGLRVRSTALAAALRSLETAGDFTLDQLTRLRSSFQQDVASANAVVADLTARMGEIESSRREWEELRDLWAQWEADVPSEAGDHTVKLTFAEARAAVEQASGLLSRAVPKVVQAQRTAVDLQGQFQESWAKLEDLIAKLKEGLFGLWSPPMLTEQYRKQFEASLRETLAGTPGEAAGLRPRASPNWGWFVLLHLAVFAGFALALRWSKVEGPVREKWGALLDYPFAAGTLAGVLLPVALYLPAQKLPPVAALGLGYAATVATIRLAPRLIASRALRHALFVMMALFLLDRTFRAFGFPTTLLRAYNAALAGIASPLCFRRAAIWRRAGEPRALVVAYLAAGVLFGAACIAQLAGFSSLGFRLVDGLVFTTFLVPLGWMFSLLLRGGTELLLEHGVLNRWGALKNRRSEILTTLGIVTDGATFCLFGALLLVVWRVEDTPLEAVKIFLDVGFSWGEQRFTVGLALAALVVLYLSLTVSRTVQAVLEGQVYAQRKIDPGAGISINRLIHYGFVLVGVLMALGTMGIGIGKLAVLAGALGVGIGFGLQNIVNNFVSGLILLTERPVKVGDVLQLGTDWGKVTQLGMRATTIQTFDRSEIIVPNSELIAGRVVNWSHSDRMARLLLPVGVAYGSDVAAVMRILEEVATAHLKVASDPKPEAVFLSFGESALEFQLMAWVWDIEDRLRVRSELLASIDQRFREAGIVIPFPQRVVHLAKEGSRTPGSGEGGATP